MKIQSRRIQRQQNFHHRPHRRDLLLDLDRETITILTARQLVRRHPQIIERLFPGKGVSIEQAVKSIHHIGTAREAVLIADMMGFVRGMI